MGQEPGRGHKHGGSLGGDRSLGGARTWEGEELVGTKGMSMGGEYTKAGTWE